MMRNDWTSVSVNRTLIIQIERILQTPAGRKNGLTNMAQFVDLALREKIERIGLQRFSHINTDDKGMTVLDTNLDRAGRIVTISFNGSEMECDYCHDAVCVHVQYAWAIPEIRRDLEGRGLIRREPQRNDV